jgi:oxygen-independent coproporphyrinogen-3 oxidase
MAGLYYHIPYCKQACHYCDFHFSTQLKSKRSVILAMQQELKLRASELKSPLRSIYFGGGTPSLLAPEEIAVLIGQGQRLGRATSEIEITLEVNPDDVSPQRLKDWKNAGINRLSLGIQSFSARDLKFMNRAHDVEQAHQALVWIARQFENFSVDLIYGVPQEQGDSWANNLAIISEFKPPHLSCYALTREPGTAMDKFMQRGVMPEIDEDQAQREYQTLVHWAQELGYVNYEFSNFALPGYESVNNSAYWSGLPYLGIGPSAHSYDGQTRSWNVANNALYLKSLAQEKLPITREELTFVDRYNEYVMTRLRTAKGINLDEVARIFDQKTRDNLVRMADKPIQQGLLFIKEGHLVVGAEGKFLTDGIASALFLVNLGS